MRSAILILTTSLVASCGDKEKAPLPAVVRLVPQTGASGISIAARVQALIDRENADACSFDMAATTFTVTKNGAPVDGFLVFFVDGRRVDFTPRGLFDFGTTYDVSVQVPCSAPATASFTTIADAGGAPAIVEGDAFRATNLAISEPQAAAPPLQSFLTDTNVVFGLLSYDSTQLRAIGGDSAEAGDAAGVYPFVRNGFFFPMLGTLKWPYFQIVGILDVDVNNAVITLDPFEIAGRFEGASPTVAITEGLIRASASCDDVCATGAPELGVVCGNRSSMCDQAGTLNLIGSYIGPSDDLRGYQTISVTPADAATAVPTTTTIDVVLTHAVDPTSTGSVVVELRDPAGTLVAGTTAVEQTQGLSATFTPSTPLASNTLYTVLVVAFGFAETTFTTGN